MTVDKTVDQNESPAPEAGGTEELREQVEQTREELGDTVAQLAAKADVKQRAQDKAAETKAQVQSKAAETKAQVQDKAAEAKAQVQDKAAEAKAQVQQTVAKVAEGVKEHTPEPVQHTAAQVNAQVKEAAQSKWAKPAAAVAAGLAAVFAVLKLRRHRN